MLGTEVLGSEPLSVIAQGESNATIEPFVSLFDQPEIDLVFLIEAEIGQEAMS